MCLAKNIMSEDKNTILLQQETLRETVGRLAKENRGNLLEFSQKTLDYCRLKLDYIPLSKRITTTKQGIFFANHEGSLDTMIMVSMINDMGVSINKLKIFVGEKTYPFYTSHFHPDNFLIATHKPRAAQEQFLAAIKHVSDEGSILIFPTGQPGQEILPGQPFFKPGLTFILENLNNNVPVVATHIGNYNSSGPFHDNQRVPVRTHADPSTTWSNLFKKNVLRQQNSQAIEDRYQKIFSSQSK